MAATDLVRSRVASLGMSLLHPAAGLAALERMLAAPALAARPGGGGSRFPQHLHSPPAVVDVTPFKWSRLAQRAKLLPDLFEGLIQETAADAAGAGAAAVATVTRPKAGGPATSGTVVAVAPVDQHQKATATVTSVVLDLMGREVSLHAAALRSNQASFIYIRIHLLFGLWPLQLLQYAHELS